MLNRLVTLMPSQKLSQFIQKKISVRIMQPKKKLKWPLPQLLAQMRIYSDQLPRHFSQELLEIQQKPHMMNTGILILIQISTPASIIQVFSLMGKFLLKKFIALIYLNDQSLDFAGGRFIFEASEVGKLSQTQYVEPRAGRLGMVEE